LNNNYATYNCKNGGTTSTPTFTANSAFGAKKYGMTMSADGTKVCSTGENGAFYSTNGTATTPTFTASTWTNPPTGSVSDNVSYCCSSSAMDYVYFCCVDTPYMMVSTNTASSFSYVATSLTITVQHTSACNVTGKYVGYITATGIYLSNNYATSFVLLTTVSGATFTNIAMYTTDIYIAIVATGGSVAGVYAGFALISGCTTAANWTWSTIKTDQVYGGLTITPSGTLYVVGTNTVLTGQVLIDVPPTPDLLWLKMDNTTITASIVGGSNGSTNTTLVNAAVGNNIGSAYYWGGTLSATLNLVTTTHTVSGSYSLYSYTGSPFTNSVVTTPSFSLPSTSGSGYTISLWYYNNNGAANNPFYFFVNNTGSNSATCVYSTAVGNMTISGASTCVFTNNSNTTVTLTTSFASSVWNHFAYTNTCTTNNSATGGSGQLYWNGNLVSGGTTTAYYGGVGCVLGLWSNMISCNFYDVRIYGSVLSPTQILTMYNTTK
jgi:hypothetical protein